MRPPHDLPELLDTLDPQAELVQRHLWLIALFQWLRGDCRSVAASLARVNLLLDAVQVRAQTQQRLHAWWQALIDTLDATTLLADFGFSSRSAFLSEFFERLRQKLLPGTPETADASALFSLVLCDAFDAQLLAALDEATLQRIAGLLLPAPAAVEHGAAIFPWQNTVLEAITFCTSQVRSAGFSPEFRLRMSAPAREAGPFHALAHDFDRLRDAYLASPEHDSNARQAALLNFRERLEGCRQAAASVYTHLDAHGISVNLVFQLRQMRERVLRIRALLDCLLSSSPAASTARLLAHLVSVGQERRSLGALIAANTSLLAAKVAERSSEAGEHYITRNKAEYRDMLRKAAGGGALTALTTWMKFAVLALGLSAFWSGFWAGAAYAASFVVIQLLHFTLATKQPAMTAPAMAAKLKDLGDPNAFTAFADEVTHLVRSQVAAVLGNVLLVFPAVLLISAALQQLTGRPMIDLKEAEHVFHSLTLLGPTALFAAFTGVLLFASSIIAGWVENWFVLHRLDSAMRYNPRITVLLGSARAALGRLHALEHLGLRRQYFAGFHARPGAGVCRLLRPDAGSAPRHAVGRATGRGLRRRGLERCLRTGAVVGCGLAAADGRPQPARELLSGLSPGHNVTGIDRVHVTQAITQRWRHAPLSFLWPTRDAATLPAIKD